MCAELTDPVKIGKITLNNRMYAAPMVSLYADEDGNVTPRLVDLYRKKAMGGWGLVCVEAATVRFDGRLFTRMLGIHNDRQIAGLNELAEAISDEGSKSCIQIMHGGRQASSRYNGGIRPLGVSPVSPWPPNGPPPAEMSTTECGEMADSIARAAGRAKEAGFDCVQLHAAHGFLMQQFLSPYTNRRSDIYGKGTAFLLEVIEKVKKTTGPDYPIGIRLSVDEFLGDRGLVVDDVLENIIPPLENAGIDWFDISVGTFETLVHWIPSIYFKKAYLAEFAAKVKQIVSVPVSGIGRINDPDLAQKIIKQGSVDIVAFGRQVLADPFFPNKVIRGRKEEIRKCIYCDMGCTNRLLKSFGIKCSINYEFGKDNISEKTASASVPKKILIAGAGVAGMEAAGILAMRGHEVFLREKDEKTGGLVRLASSIPRVSTGDLFEIAAFLEARLKRLNVNLETGIKVDLKCVKEINPDIVLLATGSLPLMPAPEKITKDAVNVISYDSYIRGIEIKGEKIIVLGGRHGAETALSLSRKGKHVILIEESSGIADTPYIYYGRMLLLHEYLRENNVDIMTDTRTMQINKSGVIVMNEQGDEKQIHGDTVVSALGRVPNRELLDILTSGNVRHYLIGDCHEPENIMKAIHRASKIAGEI